MFHEFDFNHKRDLLSFVKVLVRHMIFKSADGAEAVAVFVGHGVQRPLQLESFGKELGKENQFLRHAY